jgi:hypothetical protein
MPDLYFGRPRKIQEKKRLRKLSGLRRAGKTIYSETSLQIISYRKVPKVKRDSLCLTSGSGRQLVDEKILKNNEHRTSKLFCDV